MSFDSVWPLFASGFGMMIVAAVAVMLCRRSARVPFRWYWAGAGLWTVSVALKVICARLTTASVLGSFQGLSHPLHVALGALYLGLQSSIFEMGFTILAVLIWRQLGRDADRATAIGVGAGAVEAFLLGVGVAVYAVVLMYGSIPERQITQISADLEKTVAATPLFWLAGPVERIIAILCHASTRALILLGVSKRRSPLVFWGFLLFTLLDGVAGAFIVAGAVANISSWWIELGVLPFGLVSIPILIWCRRRWPEETLTSSAS